MRIRRAGSNARMGGEPRHGRMYLALPAPDPEQMAGENHMSGPDTMDRPGRSPDFSLARSG